MSAVDVVIAVKDGGRGLRRAVLSVLRQTDVDLRVIVVDDGSRDGAPERLPKDPRLVVVPNRGRGVYPAVNTGIALGDAPLIARQDADDESLPGRLAAEVRFLEDHPGIGLVGTAFEVVAGRRCVTVMRPELPGMLERNPFCAGSTVVRREVLEAAGGYREQFSLAGDYDAWLRCAWVSGVAILPIIGYRYRLSADMVTIRRSGEQAALAELARASARARIDGQRDPADSPESWEPVTGWSDPADDAEVAAWWAHEFAALGARREALRCALAARAGLSRRRAIGVFASALAGGEPRGGWA
jgi:glycosyltransferase involved in cell wall biosynthesis